MEFTVFIICMGAGLLFVLISLAAGHIGGGHGHIGSGGHASTGADGSDGDSVSAFSPTVISAFIMAFGGFGIIFHEIPATKPIWLSVPLAIVCGLLCGYGLMALLRKLFRHSQSSSESKIGTLVGMSATVISPIAQNGMGEIAYVQGGSRYTAPARTESGSALAAGQTVKINRIIGTQFYVVPI